jgi:hypothetical protein
MDPEAIDTQTLELLGRHRLANELLLAGLEVASPLRDRGVDLIAYADIDKQAGCFVARPIQMKAASQRSFGIWKKYLKIHDLILAFVWHVDGKAKPETYALTCAEAVKVGDAMGWTTTPSWRDDGAYTTTRPGEKLYGLLQPHRMDAQKWWAKVVGTGKDGAVEQGVEADEAR